MAGTQLAPEKITSPFQLMAAWFAMLVLLVSVLLTGAAKIAEPEWAAGYLVIFTSVVVLIVVASVLLMLTKFRPHLQEGKEYAEWLKDQNTYSSGYLVKRPKQEKLSLSELRPVASPVSTANVLVSASNAAGVTELIESIKNLGFNAEIYQSVHAAKEDKPPIELSDRESVWVGSRVPASAAIKVIKTAIRQWPQLKYLHLSGDGGDPPDYVHYQIFIGGATSAAKRYGLKKWANDELFALNDNMSMNEFHQAIRAKYS